MAKLIKINYFILKKFLKEVQVGQLDQKIQLKKKKKIHLLKQEMKN